MEDHEFITEIKTRKQKEHTDGNSGHNMYAFSIKFDNIQKHNIYTIKVHGINTLQKRKQTKW